VRGRNKAPGEFRKSQVQIGSSGRFIPPPPTEITRLTSDLEKYINAEDPRYDPLVRSYIVHYQFETIHPFVDGNGRVGRALHALMIYKWMGHAMPWLYVSAFYEQFKDEYIENLFLVSAEGQWERWIRFCLVGTILQANDSILRCHKFNRLRTEFHSRVDSPSPRSHQLVESLFTAPVLTIPSVQKQFGIHYQTAKSDIDRLVEAGILTPMEHSHPKSFFAREVMKIAYGESTEEQPEEQPGPGPAD
jgi:Fic family protein